METPLVSIIIRTKNEERWISSCLRAIYAQSYKNIEVIIVDNKSTDLTIRKAKEFPVSIISIDDFLPGKAINDGIRASKGEIIVCLSGHCVPVDQKWLKELIADLDDKSVAGVYGRQEPLSYSSDFDKRDLIIVFGLDKKIQIKDSFFHNANSAFRRDVWNKFPFDEEITNIEDRLWGGQVIAAGMKIIYQPAASVYHWHGIHQDLNPERARKIVRILESHGIFSTGEGEALEGLKCVAIIPIRGKSRKVGDKYLLEYSIKTALQSKYITDVIVSTDDEETATLAKSMGAKVPFLRPKELSDEYVDIIEVLRYSINRLEETESVCDLVVLLEETYPLRSLEMLDEMIARLVTDGYDTVVAAKEETRGIWMQKENDIELLAEGFMPRNLKKSRSMVGLLGLGCVTRPTSLRNSDIFSGKLGLYEIHNPFSAIEVRDEVTRFSMAELINSNAKVLAE